jgi:hypothetical protein
VHGPHMVLIRVGVEPATDVGCQGNIWTRLGSCIRKRSCFALIFLAEFLRGSLLCLLAQSLDYTGLHRSRYWLGIMVSVFVQDPLDICLLVDEDITSVVPSDFHSELLRALPRMLDIEFLRQRVLDLCGFLLLSEGE